MSSSIVVAPVGFSDAWRQWIATCLMSEVDVKTVVAVLTDKGFNPIDAQEAIQLLQADPVLIAGKWMAQRLAKLESLLEVRHELERLAPEEPVDRRGGVGTDEFLARYYAANRPVLLDDVVSAWPAREKWGPEYLRTTIGGELVEVMDGRDGDARYEINSVAHKRLMPFTTYVDIIQAAGGGNNTYIVGNNRLLEREAARPLWEDFRLDERYLGPSAPPGTVFLWYGPSGTVTPLHHDVANILFTQVVGRKRVTLISPLQTPYLYNDRSVFSEVDPHHPDLDRFPRFAGARPVELVVGPGDALFIPVGWWHQVEALDTSISVSFTNFRFPNTFSWRHPSIDRDRG